MWHALDSTTGWPEEFLSKSTDCCPFDLKSNGEAIVVAGTAACPPDTGAGDWPSSIMRSVLIKAPRSNDSKERWGPGGAEGEINLNLKGCVCAQENTLSMMMHIDGTY